MIISTLEMSFPGEDGRAVLLVANATPEGVVHPLPILGTVVLKFTARKQNAEFARLFVHPSHRQQGVARALLARCEKIAKSAGALYLTATVNKENDHALGFYEKTGHMPIYTFADGDVVVWKAIE